MAGGMCQVARDYGITIAGIEVVDAKEKFAQFVSDKGLRRTGQRDNVLDVFLVTEKHVTVQVPKVLSDLMGPSSRSNSELVLKVDTSIILFPLK